MGLTKIESEVKALLAETIIALCRNTLKFQTDVSVEGLLGVTLDNQEIFLLNIKESIHLPNDSDPCVTKQIVARESDGDSLETVETISNTSSRKRRRKRHRPRQIVEADQVNEQDSDSDCVEFLSPASKAVLEKNCDDIKIKTEAPESDTENVETQQIPNNIFVTPVKTEECQNIDSDLSCNISNISNTINGQDPLLGNISNLSEVFVPDPLSFDYYGNHFRYHSFPPHPLLASLYSAQVFGELAQESEPPQQISNVSPQKECKSRRMECKSNMNSTSSQSARMNHTASTSISPQDFSLHYGPQDSPEQQRTCHLCNKMFPSRSHRAVHMRTHTGERPFRCPLCGKDFNQRQVMYRHMRNIHHVHPDSTRTFMNRRRTSSNAEAMSFLQPTAASTVQVVQDR